MRAVTRPCPPPPWRCSCDSVTRGFTTRMELLLNTGQPFNRAQMEILYRRPRVTSLVCNLLQRQGACVLPVTKKCTGVATTLIGSRRESRDRLSTGVMLTNHFNPPTLLTNARMKATNTKGACSCHVQNTKMNTNATSVYVVQTYWWKSCLCVFVRMHLCVYASLILAESTGSQFVNQ